MNIKKILSENLYAAFLALCATILSESALLRLAGITVPLAVAITAVVITSAVVFIWFNRKSSAVYIGIAAMLIIILSVLSLFGVSLIEFSLEAIQHLFAGDELEAGEILFITSLSSLLLAVVLFPLLKIKAARYGFGVLTIVFLAFYGINGIIADPVESFAAAGVIISVLSELSLILLYKGEQKKKLGGVLSFMLPLFAAFSLAVAVIPSEKKPISWQFVTDAAMNVANAFRSFADELRLFLNPELSEFDIGMQGYSDESSFSGGLYENNGTQLTLTGTTRLRSSVYLIGSVSDTYSTNGWSKSNYPYFSENEYYLDYCETICAFERAGLSLGDLQSFTERAGLHITYGDILTKTLFYPLKTVRLYTPQGFNAQTPMIMLESKAANGSEYSLSFLEINYRSKEFAELVSAPYEYGGANIGKHTLDADIPIGIEDALSERAEYIESTCTSLPDTVTGRTQELADSITADYSSDYEKLCAIEAYLRGYEYTLTPGAVPDGFDAVDYFLFESKQGFCTYFASAMAVLARCEGIPTRYVQGFIADCASADIVRSCPIQGSAAHAWTEAYIEGFGWVPFEPTASRSGSRYGYADGMSWNTSDNYEFNYPQANINEEQSTEEEAEEDNGSSFYLSVFFFTFFGIVLTAVGYAALRVRSFLKAYKVGTDTEKFLKCYKLTLLLFAQNKLAREAWETSEGFAARVSEQLNGSDGAFIEITEVFGRIRYGNGITNSDERERFEHYLKQMFETFSKKRGKASALILFIGYCFSQ